MQHTAIAIAIFAALLNHYVYSFQRFTGGIARKHTLAKNGIVQIQLLMTPQRMGAAGWGGSGLVLAASVLLGFAFFWWVGLAYFIIDMVVIGGFFPLFQLQRHFARIARSELKKHVSGPEAAIAMALLCDVDRAEACALK